VPVQRHSGCVRAAGPGGRGRTVSYHNKGDGTFSDVSEKSGMWTTLGNYALSAAVADFDNDGWPDIYVANDSTAATLYQNQKDGTFRDVAIEDGVWVFSRWTAAGGHGRDGGRLQSRRLARHCKD